MSTEVTTTSEKTLTPIQAMRGTLDKMRPDFQSALPPQIPVEKFIRTTLTAIQMQPDLLDTDRRSLLGSCMKAAQDGLIPDGREAALVIFRTKEGPKTQYMPMVGGILKKIRNSGELLSISANVVYEKDQFEYELGDYEAIKHKPFLGAERGKAIAVYAVARTKDGGIYREVMSVTEVDKVRQTSRAKDSGPWTQWWDEMARKTVIRRIAKRLPSSADVDAVFESDDETTDFKQRETVDITPAPSIDNPGEPSRLKAQIIDADTGEVQQAEGSAA